MPYPIILASASPRRKELLAKLVPEFTVVDADIDEPVHTCDDPFLTAQRLAKEKALAVFEKHPDSLIIAGDTVVAYKPTDEQAYVQLAKPSSESEAVSMLNQLSGRDHLVITGVAIRWPRGLEAFTEQTKVVFRKMTSEEIAEYVATGEPMDKAGAYAIQGGAKNFVERVEGSVSNVIGLPVEALEQSLKSIR